jgi:glycosyltransferase involved in cell wall biosynthesis
LISISKFTTAGYQRLCPTATNIESIPNGVHLAPFARVAPRPETLDARVPEHDYVLFLGRLNRRKGVDVLLDAFAQLPPHSNASLVIAGDGDERATLEAQCAELGLTDRVHFVGAVSGDAKVWLLQNARCVVIPSRDWEAFPLVVLESFAAGKPVVGTRIAGLEDLIEPQRTGMLVPPESPRSLAEALAFLVRDESAALDMGQHARQLVQEFDWRNIAEQHLRLYQRLCNGVESQVASSEASLQSPTDAMAGVADFATPLFPAP